MATKRRPEVEELDELIERCAGIDVGQAEVVVCARVPDRSGKRCRLIGSFGTTVPDLLALHDWLAGLGVTHVAMESTGVYWKSPYYLLEDELRGVAGERRPCQARPGTQDRHHRCRPGTRCLLSAGAAAAKFSCPPPPIRELARLDPLPQGVDQREVTAR